MPRFAFLAALMSAFAGGAFAQKGADTTAVPLKSAADGLPLMATYLPASAGVEGPINEAPVLILLHGANGDRLVWEKKPTTIDKKPLARVLNDEGFAVLTLDLRGHGESPLPGGRGVRNNDYEAMLGDIEAAKRFLMEEHEAERLNINKLGIVAADDSAALAMAYAKLDWEKPDYDDAPVPSQRTPRGRDVRALVLLSPSDTAGRVRLLTGLTLVREPSLQIATLVLYGKDDPRDDGLSDKIGRQLRADDDPKDRYMVFPYPTRARGTDLIGDPNVQGERAVVGFLSDFLKTVESPWVTRKSRLVR